MLLWWSVNALPRMATNTNQFEMYAFIKMENEFVGWWLPGGVEWTASDEFGGDFVFYPCLSVVWMYFIRRLLRIIRVYPWLSFTSRRDRHIEYWLSRYYLTLSGFIRIQLELSVFIHQKGWISLLLFSSIDLIFILLILSQLIYPWLSEIFHKFIR